MGMVYPLDLMQKLLLTKDMIWLSVSMIMNYQINQQSIYIYNSIHDEPETTYQTIELNTIAKNPHFEYEKECRIPLREHYGKYCITKRDQFFPIKYDIKRGVISPFVDIFIPLEAIREIWIGPTNESNLAKDSLNSWLNSIGMNWIKIEESSAPFR